MQVAARVSDRMVVQIGSGIGLLDGQTVEDVTDATLAQITALLPQAQGDGGVILSPDHASVTLQGPSAAWIAGQQAAAAALSEQTAATTDLRDQYATAIARLDQIIGATTFTSAQVAAAVQDEARILRRTLRLLKDALAP